MPSFLSKVFGRKKDEKEPNSPTTATSTATKRLSAPASLLEGKYEAVSPTVSPTAAQFSDASRQHHQQPSKGVPLALFRSRSRNPIDQSKTGSANTSPTLHLTLNLPVPKEEKSRALGVVFEADPDNPAWLSDKKLEERRLSPLETLVLVQACSRAIIEHGGLETLGLMHPHWYAASPDVQRKLISLFVLSTGGGSTPVSTLSPSPTSTSALFETELNYTRSPHDVAAVLRWGIRHLKLEGSSFGKDASGSSEWGWYTTFATSEREAEFPSAAFSKALVPLLPPAHLQLLTTTLDIIGSLAAHAEKTGTSGSKLVRLFGLWLISAQRARKDEDWAEFYKRWESAGKVLEHLFLAHVREESINNKMPLRLSEMVKHYPFGTTATTPIDGDLPFLISPRFSTRQYDALYVRLDILLPGVNTPRPPRQHPLELVSEALKATAAADASIAEEIAAIWEAIRDTASGESPTSSDEYPALSRILDDETIRLLSLVPGGQPVTESSPKSGVTSPPTSPIVRTQPSRRRSSSLGPANGTSKPTSNGHGLETPASPTDWADFSKLGFGESSLGKDLSFSLPDTESRTTSPASPSNTRTSFAKKRRASSPGRGRRSSVDSPRPTADDTRGRVASGQEDAMRNTITRITQIGAVTIDEAFFDFWSDALLDPIASDWPSFVVCQLKPSTWKYNLLVVEQTVTRPVPPPLPPTPQAELNRRAASPKPSLSPSTKGRKSFTFSPTIKRFSFFSKEASSGEVNPRTSSKRSGAKATKSPRIGEMGEILPVAEEPAPRPSEVQDSKVETSPSQGLGIIAEGGTDAAAPAVPEKTTKELPEVPLVNVEPTPVAAGEIAPSAIESVKTEEEAPERPTVTPHDATVDATNGTASQQRELPPAPEAVVLTGSTPGPLTALETSEPVALAQASEPPASSGVLNEAPSSDIPVSSDVAEPVQDEAPVSDIVHDEAAAETHKVAADQVAAAVPPVVDDKPMDVDTAPATQPEPSSAAVEEETVPSDDAKPDPAPIDDPQQASVVSPEPTPADATPEEASPSKPEPATSAPSEVAAESAVTEEQPPIVEQDVQGDAPTELEQDASVSNGDAHAQEVVEAEAASETVEEQRPEVSDPVVEEPQTPVGAEATTEEAPEPERAQEPESTASHAEAREETVAVTSTEDITPAVDEDTTDSVDAAAAPATEDVPAAVDTQEPQQQHADKPEETH